jgi:aspartyl-tRNA(Asn)/glutamyl-tRNA(Gln) amidotransferase subunit C
MKLTRVEVDHIADLARLDLTEEEKESFRQQLSAILEHVARLQKLDTTGISPTSSVLPEHGTLRGDIPVEGLSTASLLANAPLVKKQQFRVPPVFE